jgi:hypothetical protein
LTKGHCYHLQSPPAPLIFQQRRNHHSIYLLITSANNLAATPPFLSPLSRNGIAAVIADANSYL